MRYIVHAVGHVGAVEIGAQADVVRADEFYGMIDVVDDFGPVDAREFALRDVFSRTSLSPSISWQASFAPQRFLISASISLPSSGWALSRVAKFLAEECRRDN